MPLYLGLPKLINTFKCHLGPGKLPLGGNNFFNRISTECFIRGREMSYVGGKEEAFAEDLISDFSVPRQS